MKTQLIRTQLIRTMSVALLAAAYMFGQDPQQVVVRIPFGFHAGASRLPAGQYTLASEVRSGIVRLRSADFKSSIMLLTSPISPHSASDVSKLIFNRYGNEYYLSQIWTTSGENGRGLPMTKAETRSAANASRGLESVMARK